MLVIGRPDHQQHQRVERDLVASAGAAPQLLDESGRGAGRDFDGRSGLPRGAQEVRSKEAHSALLVNDGIPQVAVHRNMLDPAGHPEDRVEGEQHRQLGDEREAAAQGVCAVLLVELVDFLGHAHAVAAELSLQLLDLGLQGLLGLHRPHLLDVQGEQDDPDCEREDDDRGPVVRDHVVYAGEEPPDTVQERLEGRDAEQRVHHQTAAPSVRGDLGYARMSSSYKSVRDTGECMRWSYVGGWSTPPAVQGPHRSTRQAASALPRAAPNSRIASSAYAEQEG